MVQSPHDDSEKQSHCVSTTSDSSSSTTVVESMQQPEDEKDVSPIATSPGKMMLKQQQQQQFMQVGENHDQSACNSHNSSNSSNKSNNSSAIECYHTNGGDTNENQTPYTKEQPFECPHDLMKEIFNEDERHVLVTYHVPIVMEPLIHFEEQRFRLLFQSSCSVIDEYTRCRSSSRPYSYTNLDGMPKPGTAVQVRNGINRSSSSSHHDMWFSFISRDLFDKIRPDKCKYDVQPKKLLLRLVKLRPSNWGNLYRKEFTMGTVFGETISRKLNENGTGVLASSSGLPPGRRISTTQVKSKTALIQSTPSFNGNGLHEAESPSASVRNSTIKPDISKSSQNGFENQSSKPLSSASSSLPPPNEEKIEKSVKQMQLVSQRPSYPIGHTGLRNLGNTCFMNSTLQCLSNTEPLRDYFLQGQYTHHLNHENPLGSQGKIAIQFGELLKHLWSGESSDYTPHQFKMLFGRKCSQFADCSQHDAVEFMEAMLDALHEDLNRADRRQPIANVPIENEDELSDEQLSSEQWKRFTERNNSIITELFYGQLKSKLTCPVCSKVSVTFDPFSYLAIPMTKSTIEYKLYYFSLTEHQPKLITAKLPPSIRMGKLLEVVANKVGVSNRELVLYNFSSDGQIGEQVLEFATSMPSHSSYITFESSKKRLVAFQKPPRSFAGRTFLVQQRLKFGQAPAPISCEFCHSTLVLSSMKIKPLPCRDCKKVYFCNEDCYSKDISKIHSHDCRPSTKPFVGWPFIMACTDDNLNYEEFMQILQKQATHTVVLENEKLHLDHIEVGEEVQEGRVDSNEHLEECESTAKNKNADACQSSKPIDQNGETDDGDALHSASQLPHQSSDEITSSIFPFRLYGKFDSPDFEIDLSDDFKKITGAYFLILEWQNAPPNAAFVDEPETGTKMEIDGEDSNQEAAQPIEKQQQQQLHACVNVMNSPETQMRMDKLFSSEFDCDPQDSRNNKNEYTLEESIRKFTEPETLSSQEAWRCPKCKEPREASKQLTIWRPPPILIIQLKRFSYTSFVREKIGSLVKCPIEQLDISQFCSQAEHQTSNPPIYDLYGVIDHYGSLYCGHYTSRASSSKESKNLGWRLFDDSSVSSVSPKVAQSAYVLFYKLRRNNNNTNNS